MSKNGNFIVMKSALPGMYIEKMILPCRWFALTQNHSDSKNHVIKINWLIKLKLTWIWCDTLSLPYSLGVTLYSLH